MLTGNRASRKSGVGVARGPGANMCSGAARVRRSTRTIRDRGLARRSARAFFRARRWVPNFQLGIDLDAGL